jgi:signal transduction histidine kinase
MLEEVDQLTNMVNTMLTIGRADAGQLELHGTVFSLNDLEGRDRRCWHLGRGNKQTIHMAIEGNPYVQADRSFFRLAVLNILDNAIKYSPSGGSISVCLKDMESPLHSVELSVEDDGPGIPEQSREKVFDRFYRVEKDRSREAGGAGLGLAIAKWAVEVHGGKIVFRPSAGKGSVFYMQLPRAYAIFLSERSGCSCQELSLCS